MLNESRCRMLLIPFGDFPRLIFGVHEVTIYPYDSRSNYYEYYSLYLLLEIPDSIPLWLDNEKSNRTLNSYFSSQLFGFQFWFSALAF